MTCHYFWGKPSVGARCLVTGLHAMTFHYFGQLLWEAFRRGQLLSLVTGLLLMTFHYFGWLLWKAFRRGQLLSNRVTF